MVLESDVQVVVVRFDGHHAGVDHGDGACPTVGEGDEERRPRKRRWRCVYRERKPGSSSCVDHETPGTGTARAEKGAAIGVLRTDDSGGGDACERTPGVVLNPESTVIGVDVRGSAAGRRSWQFRPRRQTTELQSVRVKQGSNRLGLVDHPHAALGVEDVAWPQRPLYLTGAHAPFDVVMAATLTKSAGSGPRSPSPPRT